MKIPDMALQQLPKVELHLHLDCGLSFEVVSQIDPTVTKKRYQEEYIAPPKCDNLADFLTRAVKGFALMQTTGHLKWVVNDLEIQNASGNRNRPVTGAATISIL